MTSPHTIFWTLLAMNLAAVSILSLSYMQSSHPTRSVQSKEFIQEEEPVYRFDDPFVAYHLLKHLDIFGAVEEGEIYQANYSRSGGGFTINNDYCDQHRAHFISNPESVFKGKNIVSDFFPHHKLRTQVFPMINATDLHPEIYVLHGRDYPQYKYPMKLNANVFYMFSLYYYAKQIGKQFSCISQASNHIPGHEIIYRKDFAAQAIYNYAKKYETQPECFNYDQNFPKTWVLRNKNQCLDFFAEFNGPRYQLLKKERNLVYFRKIGAGAHEGSGVFPVTPNEEDYIRTLYKNGTLCGKIRQNNLIQYNVHNPLLIHNRKFGFRVFMLIASTNPMIAYYHDGYIRLSIDEYDANSKETKTFVTNIGVNLPAAQRDQLFKGMGKEEINEYTCWFFDQLRDYLLERGIIDDQNWVENYLRPQFMKAMIHLVRIADGSMFKKSSLFELLGLDFVMDDNLGLWYIETNTMPLVNGFTQGSTKLLNKMLADTMEIVIGLIRSRMKRVVLYINELTKEIREEGNNLEIANLEERREMFKKISQNKWEPEFKPSPENGFYKIVDQNEVGTSRYRNLLPHQCFSDEE